MSKGSYFIGGILFGGIAGFVSAEFLLKERYRQKRDEDVLSVKKTYREVLAQYKEGKSADEEKEPEKRVEPIVSAKLNASRAKEKPNISNYVNYARGLASQKKEATNPIVITPDEFGEKDGYEQISLTWYADKVLADDSDHRMDDEEIEQKIGLDALNHFGEYEDDSVFVRNDELKCDYEILADRVRKYSDVIEDKPYLKD